MSAIDVRAASRLDSSVTQAEGWGVLPPWPQLIARAVLRIGALEIDVLNVHVPNGSGNGWKKIETFECLADYLCNATDRRRILGGDFNEPAELRPTGQMITFGQKVLPSGRAVASDIKRDKFGEEHPRYRWDHAVRAVLAGPSSHGLRHAFLDRHGFRAEATHVTARGKRPRWFDHLLVSHHFSVEDAGYRHDWREQGLSDHSAAWARLALR